MSALLTDLYQLTMAAGYFEAGKASDMATFELFVRRLPERRNYLLAAGLEQALDYLLTLRFESDEIDYLRGLPQLSRVSPAFFDYLRDFRFTGTVEAVPEGTPVFPGEPLLTVTAPIIEAQIPETFLLATIGFQTSIASKAARIVEAAQGRPVVEMGTRRAQSPEAGLQAARAAYLAGCAGTSNVLAGYRYGVPVLGTAAHSWVMAFPDEREAFARLQSLLGPFTVYLIDTYDTLEGARAAARLGQPISGVRLDSGDLGSLSRSVRMILDEAGLRDARILATNDLNEHRIRELLSAGAPIDSFGVGTELVTSADAPALGVVYKMVEVTSRGETRYTAKSSAFKASVPGAKQVFRRDGEDLVALWHEQLDGQPLLQPVIEHGEPSQNPPTLEKARARARDGRGWLSPGLRSLEPAPQPYPVRMSDRLRALQEQTAAPWQEERV